MNPSNSSCPFFPVGTLQHGTTAKPLTVPPACIGVSIVDDDENVHFLASRILDQTPGFAWVSSYSTGEAGLNGIPQSGAQVVLMDIEMPGMSGVAGNGLSFRTRVERDSFSGRERICPSDFNPTVFTMKAFVLFAALWFACLSVQGQVASSGPASDPRPVKVEPGTVVEVGPHERIWTTGDSQSDRRIVEVGTGMNYWNGEKWTPSDPTFDITEDAFVADRIHFKVRLEASLNKIGAVTVITPGGIELVSTPVGIGLYDTATGESAIIGSIANCSGVLVEDNTVVYENAFKGVCADVVYRIDRGSFEQDVVITGKLNPVDYGFDPATAQIQIFTEFYGAPEPERVRRPIRIEQRQEVRNRLVSPDLVDELLGFGEFVLGTGQAFTTASFGQSGTPVAKAFNTVLGRTFLIETVDHSMIQRELESLPDCNIEQASAKKVGRSKTGYAAIPKAGSGAQAKSVRTARRVARADLAKRPGLVIDYLATIGGTLGGTTVFKGDTTYFLTNAVTCSGAATIEGGAIFKYPTNSTVYLRLNGAVTCKTSSYRPAIFTAADDDTIGDKLSTNIWASYTGVINTNGYGNPALWAYFINPTLSNLRFRHAQEAVRFEGSSASLGVLAHSQLANCIRGIVINGTFGSGSCAPTLGVNNTLIANVQYPININIGSLTGTYQHCTVDTATRLITSTAGGTVTSRNSVFANITTLSSGSPTVNGNNNGFYLAPTLGTVQFSSTNYPFQSVGAGFRYLGPGSSFRNVGTTNVGASLLNDLKKRTTYPPLVLTNTVMTATTLSPQAQRDTDLPDLGYHYDPIDYAINTLTVTNTTLTLTNGVALATFGNNGIWLTDGSQLYSEGTPLDHNHLSRFFNVQEQPTNWGGGTLWSMTTINPYNYGVSPPIAQLRFTDFDGMANSGYQILMSGSTNWILNSLLLRDCTFNSGGFYLDGPTNSSLTLNNNLFERVFISAQNAPQIAAYNNLVRFGLITTWNTGTNNWTFKDNAFDSTVIDDIGNALTTANNAYIGMGTNRFYPTNGFDKVLTAFTYTNSTLGSFYQVSTNLYDMGSRNATNAGLYHYTVKTSQVKETNSVVDIGFHYVAVTNGVPFDTDGDGYPDYSEDRNGNGTYDSGSGEIDWQTSNSGISGAAGLQVFTPLK